MGWSSGIGIMPQSSNEMRIFFVPMQLQKDSDMECRGIDQKTFSTKCPIDGKGTVQAAATVT